MAYPQTDPVQCYFVNRRGENLASNCVAVLHGLDAVGDLKELDRDSVLLAVAAELAKYPLPRFRLRRWLR